MATFSDHGRRGKNSKKFNLPLHTRAIRNVSLNKPNLTKELREHDEAPRYTLTLNLSKKRNHAASSEIILDSSKKLKHDATPLVTAGLGEKGKHAATTPVTLDSSKKSKHVTFNLDEKVDHADALPVYAVNTRPGFVACEATVLCNELWDELELKFLHENEEGALEFAMLQSVYKLSFQDAISKHSTFGDFMREEISLRMADAGVM